MPSRQKNIDWSAVPDIGKVVDAEIAQRIGCCPTAVARARYRMGIPAFGWPDRVDWETVADQLGVIPNVEIARRLGCSATAVARERRRRGIPPARPKKAIDWASVPDLGKVQDKVIAERLGVTPDAVYVARRRRGIPASKSASSSRGGSLDAKTSPGASQP